MSTVQKSNYSKASNFEDDIYSVIISIIKHLYDDISIIRQYSNEDAPCGQYIGIHIISSHISKYGQCHSNSKISELMIQFNVFGDSDKYSAIDLLDRIIIDFELSYSKNILADNGLLFIDFDILANMPEIDNGKWQSRAISTARFRAIRTSENKDCIHPIEINECSGENIIKIDFN